ncbi:Glyceraldehyde-3-phosphate dehydrogenase [uncultured archaeon]|nr:Glyceraldehyde-3-phosphate dehydrogenase [uncultured archaeon]
MVVKVAINGYGTIGKSVADAVTLQDDMKIVGVSKTRPTFEAQIANSKGFPLYVLAGNEKKFESAGIKIKGTIDDMFKEAEIVVDCTPGDFGDQEKANYTKANLKAIFQGGEDHELTGTSFNALANYKEAWGKQFVRVVSCNTSGLIRTLFPLDRDIGIERVNAVMIRRAVDPRDSKKGPVNAIKPVLEIPSHHGPDVQTVMHNLKISTMAVAVPTTLMHVHSVIVDLKKEVKKEDVLKIWESTPRVMLIDGAKGLPSTAEVMEYARDLGHTRGDFNSIIVWRDGMNVVGKTLYYYQAIHQESDVIPENIDCIRSMMKTEADNTKSIQKTEKTMGIK